MNGIGPTLKEARAKQALSLEEVHAKIKIHPRVLQLLEEEKFDKLPSPLFAKSFLKSYADFLSVDTDQVMSQYEKIEKKEPEQVIFIKPAEMRERKSADLSWLAGPAVAAALVAGGFGLWIAAGAIRESLPKWKPAPPKTAAPKKAAASKPVPAKEEKPASSDWLRSPSQGNFPSIPKRTPLELKVKAVDNVWMRVTADGKVVFQTILKRGATETWTAKQSIEIWTGNSSNMVLALNGNSLGSPGKGVVKKLTITHDGVRIPS
jgi:cytoskeletal protein RodZ